MSKPREIYRGGWLYDPYEYSQEPRARQGPPRPPVELCRAWLERGAPVPMPVPTGRAEREPVPGVSAAQWVEVGLSVARFLLDVAMLFR